MSYTARLHQAIRTKRTAALVGLDPRWDQLPLSIRRAAESRGLDLYTTRAWAFEEFCKRIIDVVAPQVPAVKPQSAFFEECGPAGVLALRNVIAYARKAGLIVICDGKRGDIGSTAEAYARAYLAGVDPDSAPFAADALTINPYMGTDTLKPFIDRAIEAEGGLYVLVRTSNPGARDFQDRRTDGNTLYEHIADVVEKLSAATMKGSSDQSYGNIGAVVGATYPEELKHLRQRMVHVPLLVPGYGSQGGTSADVAAAFDSSGLGALVNNSRGIIFAFAKGELAVQFGEARWEAAIHQATRAMIANLAVHTPLGRFCESV